MNTAKRALAVAAALVGLAAINLIASDPAGPNPDRADLVSLLDGRP